MEIKDSKILNNIPEYLIDENKNAENAKELIEHLNPNAVNVTASLIDKIYSELDDFNNWSDYDKYISEFKLDEVFDGLKKNLYEVSSPELLKGFFTFKGTSTDIEYLMKIAGYYMIMYESDYYRQAISMYDLIFFRYDTLYSEILELNTKEEIETYFDSIDLLNPNLEEIFTALKFPNPNETQYYKMYSLINIHLEALKTDFTKIDCTLTSEVYVDLDSPTFAGVRVKELHHQIREIIKSRISACIFLRELIVYLETKSFFPTKQKVYTAEEIELENETEDNLRMFCYTLRISATGDILKVNNINPIQVNKVICPAYEKISEPYIVEVEREICDKGTFNIHGTMWNRKLQNVNPIVVEGMSKEDCRENKIQGNLPTYFAIGYTPKLINGSFGKVNNIDPSSVEGRRILPTENYEMRFNDNYPTSVGGDKHYPLNNIYPMKVKGYFNFEILDSTEDILYQTETYEDLYKPHAYEVIELERSTEDSLQMFDGVSVDNYTPIRVENVSPISVHGTDIMLVENKYEIDYTRETLDKRDYIETSYLQYRLNVNNNIPMKVNNNIIIQGTRGNVYDMSLFLPLDEDGLLLDNNNPLTLAGTEYEVGMQIEWQNNTKISYFADNANPIEVNNMMPTKLPTLRNFNVNNIYYFDYTREIVDVTFDPIDAYMIDYTRETIDSFSNKRTIDNQMPTLANGTFKVHGTYVGLDVVYAYDLQNDIDITVEPYDLSSNTTTPYDKWGGEIDNVIPLKVGINKVVLGTSSTQESWNDKTDIAMFVMNAQPISIDNIIIMKIAGNIINDFIVNIDDIEYEKTTYDVTFDPTAIFETEFETEKHDRLSNRLYVENLNPLQLTNDTQVVYGESNANDYVYDIFNDLEVMKEVKSIQSSTIQTYKIAIANNVTPSKADGSYLVVGTVGDDTFDLGNLAYFMNRCNFIKVNNVRSKKVKGSNAIKEVVDSTLFVERTMIIIDYTRLKVGKSCVYDNIRKVEIGAVIQNDATVKLQGFM